MCEFTSLKSFSPYHLTQLRSGAECVCVKSLLKGSVHAILATMLKSLHSLHIHEVPPMQLTETEVRV